MRIADVVLGASTAALGAFAMVSARDLPLFGEHHVSGPGFFPLLLAAVLIVLGVLLVVTAVTRRPVAVAAVVGDERRPVRVAGVWLGFVGAITLLGVLGFIPTMIVLAAYLIFGVERIAGAERIGRIRAAAAVLLIPLIAYAVFALLLGVNLPESPFFSI
jgi:putative tricarboxylic transport membrane protein